MVIKGDPKRAGHCEGALKQLKPMEWLLICMSKTSLTEVGMIQKSKNIEDCFFFITSKGYQKGTTKEKVDFGGHAECYSSMLLLKSLVVLSNVGSCYCYLADKKLQVKREKPDFAGHAEY